MRGDEDDPEPVVNVMHLLEHQGIVRVAAMTARRSATKQAGHWSPLRRHENCLAPSTSRDAWVVFGFWSGARDLNPGPHGPEPAQWRVLSCPVVSARFLLYSNWIFFVSSCDLVYPPGSVNA